MAAGGDRANRAVQRGFLEKRNPGMTAEFPKGAEVETHSLATTKLNGKRGRVVGWQEAGQGSRVQVCIEDREVALLPTNLRIVSDGRGSSSQSAGDAVDSADAPGAIELNAGSGDAGDAAAPESGDLAKPAPSEEQAKADPVKAEVSGEHISPERMGMVSQEGDMAWWHVLHDTPVHIGPSVESEPTRRASAGELFRGRREGDWVVLVDELGFAPVKLDGRVLLEVVLLKLLVSSPRQPDFAGEYMQVPNRKPNGHPLYKQVGSRRYLYSGQNDMWFFAAGGLGSDIESLGFACSKGFVFHPAPHNGLSPAQLPANNWVSWTGSNHEPDPSVEVTSVSPEATIAVGMRVVVVEEFMSDSKEPALLAKGLQGTVVEIDADGDAKVEFSELEKREWVMRRHFDKIVVNEAHSRFPENTMIETHALKTAELNGARGRVVGLQDADQGVRVQVRFADRDVAFRPTNLKVVYELAVPGFEYVPLSEYVDDGKYWQIDRFFPGLQAIHKDPWIFIVHDLLTPAQCADLQDKVVKQLPDNGSHLGMSSHAPEEYPEVRRKFQRLFRSQDAFLEDLNGLRYKRGEKSQTRNDSMRIMPRCVSLMVYLGASDAGAGETHFPKIKNCVTGESLRVATPQGAGVLYFPGDKKTGLPDVRCTYESLAVDSFSYVVTQWARPSSYPKPSDERVLSGAMGPSMGPSPFMGPGPRPPC